MHRRRTRHTCIIGRRGLPALQSDQLRYTVQPAAHAAPHLHAASSRIHRLPSWPLPKEVGLSPACTVTLYCTATRCTQRCTRRFDWYFCPFSSYLTLRKYLSITHNCSTHAPICHALLEAKRDALPEAAARDTRPTYPPSRFPLLLSYYVLQPPCDASMSYCSVAFVQARPSLPSSEFTSGMSSSTHSGRVNRRALLETLRHTVSK